MELTNIMSTLRPTFLVGVCLALAAASPASLAPAAEIAAETAATESSATASPAADALPGVTADLLKSRVAETEAAKDLDDDAKAAILAVLRDAQAELDREADLAKQTAQFKQASQNAPQRLADIRAELGAPSHTKIPMAPSDATLTDLESQLTEFQDKLKGKQDDLTQLEAEPQRRNERRLKRIPEEIYAANKELEEIQLQAVTPRKGESKELAAARLLLLAARRQALLEQIACCTSERESYNAEDELFPKLHDLTERKVGELKQLVNAWQGIVSARRQEDADVKLKRAERESRIVYPELRGMAEENEKLAQSVTQINNDIAVAARRTVEFGNSLSELERDFQGLTKKVDLGLGQQLGPYLLQFRIDLVRRRRKLEASRLPQSQIDAVRLEWLDLTEKRNKLSDLELRTDEALASLVLSAGHSPRDMLEIELHRLLESRRELLDSLISAYERYIREMGPLTAADKELFDAIDSQLDYIDERIFWVRSTAQLSTSDLAAAGDALRWYAQPAQWRSVGRQFVHGAAARPLWTFAAAVVFIALVVARPKMHRRIRKLSEHAVRGSADDMMVTLRAFFLTVLTAAPWPALLATLAWLLERPVGGSELSDALAYGLYFTAGVLVALEFLRQVCRGRGLGASHFAWPEQSTRLLRKHFRWFVPLALPLTLLGATTHALDNDRWESLCRLIFIAAMLLLSLLIHRIFRPVGGVLHEFLASRRGTWIQQLHHFSFPLLVASPVALAALASFGYYYTARQLAWRFQASGVLFTVVLISGALLLRWVLILRRRLAMREAKQRRAAAQHDQKGAETLSMPIDAKGQLDLTTVNLQTRRFVETALLVGVAAGLWWIWADVLPALSLLNVPLWHVEAGEGVTSLEPIKVVHLLEAALALILTVVATRNIPGLLEIVLLQRLPLELATRYAVTTLFRYAITVAGLVIACLAIGVSWSKIHWLVAAVSVGLGFGLQEIFANFVSGLIILFERPIRVGDIVTVDDVSGTVSRIRIRATMITDFDCKELVVPNKEFITGRLLNWTLSDPVNRVCLTVGIAYGSDIEKARDLMLRVAAETPGVLEEPAPIASFESFGDSALNLVLRCCLPNPVLEHRLAVIHALNTKIHDTFRAEGIDIAFPQLDLHVRSSALAALQRHAA
ncbi:MAG TPA: mechanosensitive ion channel domain-containing protein [Pirellulales bacterium]|nr:mechanosensitive ion channel domain-containing protein [Pirellulales bacterium]